MHLCLRPRPPPIFEHSHSVVFQQHPVSVRCRRYCVCHFSLLPRTKTGSCTASIVLRQSASLTGVTATSVTGQVVACSTEVLGRCYLLDRPLMEANNRVY